MMQHNSFLSALLAVAEMCKASQCVNRSRMSWAQLRSDRPLLNQQVGALLRPLCGEEPAPKGACSGTLTQKYSDLHHRPIKSYKT